MPLLDNDYLERLENAPNPNEVVSELFERAKSASEERFYCNIIDIKRTINEDKSSLDCEIKNHLVVQQFAEYFSGILVPINEFTESNQVNFIRRLHMLAYSQFWECLGIQRLIRQMLNIILGGYYEPRLLLDARPNTYDLYKDIRLDASKLEMKISDFLTAVYSNQIRNAFVHSDFLILDPYISFQNHNHLMEYSIPSLKFDTWNRLFDITSDFIIAFFEAYRNAEAELVKLSPYKVSLREFKRPFHLLKDERGYWSLRP